MSTDEIRNALLCPGNSPQTVQSDPDDIAASPPQGPKADLDKSSVKNSQSSSVRSSSLSFRPASVISTFAHQQIPFTEFETQVRRLCYSLWPPIVKEHRAERLSETPDSRLLGRLRAKTFVQFLRQGSPPKESDAETSLPREFDIERMSGGTYNRVVGFTIRIGSVGAHSSFVEDTTDGVEI